MNIQHGHLYLADLNPTRGAEPGKLRPVVVIQTDLLSSTGHPSTWVLPCTTNLLGENILRVPLPVGVAGNQKACEVMVDQSRAIDNKRLRAELGTLPPHLLHQLKTKLLALCDANFP